MIDNTITIAKALICRVILKTELQYFQAQSCGVRNHLFPCDSGDLHTLKKNAFKPDVCEASRDFTHTTERPVKLLFPLHTE